MRAVETRITILLMAATMIAVGATYGLVLEHEPRNAWSLGRGGVIAAGASLCVLLGILGMHADGRRYRRRLLDTGRQWILATGAQPPAPRDAEMKGFMEPVRERIEELAGRADLLQVQKKNLEIQLRLADAQRRQSQI